MLRSKSMFIIILLILGLFIVGGVNIAVRAYNEMGGRPIPLLLQAGGVPGGYEISVAGHTIKVPDDKKVKEAWHSLTREVGKPLQKTLRPYGDEGIRLTRLYSSEIAQAWQNLKSRLQQYKDKFSL